MHNAHALPAVNRSPSPRGTHPTRPSACSCCNLSNESYDVWVAWTVAGVLCFVLALLCSLRIGWAQRARRRHQASHPGTRCQYSQL